MYQTLIEALNEGLNNYIEEFKIFLDYPIPYTSIKFTLKGEVVAAVLDIFSSRCMEDVWLIGLSEAESLESVVFTLISVALANGHLEKVESDFNELMSLKYLQKFDAYGVISTAIKLAAENNKDEVVKDLLIFKTNRLKYLSNEYLKAAKEDLNKSKISTFFGAVYSGSTNNIEFLLSDGSISNYLIKYALSQLDKAKNTRVAKILQDTLQQYKQNSNAPNR